MDKGGITKNSQGNIINKTIMWKDLRERMDWGEKPRTLEGIRLMRKVAVSMASPQKCFGTLDWVRATSNKCQFFLSAIPFCNGVLTHEE